MTNFKFIQCEKSDGVLEITLNRPEVLNSFTREMSLEFQEALNIAKLSDVRAVLITGNGRGFCAGQDLASVLPKDGVTPSLSDIVEECYNPIILTIRTIEKPFIAAVNGIAAGAGANLALACDIVLAANDASFVQSFSKIGLIPDSGGTFFLPRLVGLAKATALTMLAEKVSAEEAVRIGMIYKSFEKENLITEARSLAKFLATQPTKGLGLIKRGLNASLSNNLDMQLNMERDLQSEAGKTYDYAEGVKAFVERRAPQFKGE